MAERSDRLETWESRKIQSWTIHGSARHYFTKNFTYNSLEDNFCPAFMYCICSTISIDNEFERLSPWRSPFGLSWPVPETKVYFQMDSEIEQKTRCNFEKFVQHQCWPRNRVAKNRDGTYNLCIFISSFLPLIFFSLSNYQRTELSLFLNSLKILLSAHKQKYFLTFQNIVWPHFGLDFASLQWFFDSFELFKEAQTWRIQGSFLVKTKFFHVIHIDNVLKPSPHGFWPFGPP